MGRARGYRLMPGIVAVAIGILPTAALVGIGALSAPTATYALPWPAGLTERVLQGNHVVDADGVCRSGCGSHADRSMWFAWDFDLPEGTPVLAARGGRVVLADGGWPSSHCGTVPGSPGEANSPIGGLNLANEANFVEIAHGDGTSALYLHLSEVTPAVLAKARTGGSVRRGEMVGRSGRTGNTGCHPHLHFQVQFSVSADWFTYSLPALFQDPDVLAQQPNGVPAEGASYMSNNATTPSPGVAAD